MADAAPTSAGGVAPLAGYTVAVASDRRRHPLAELLASVGARTVGIQAARSVSQPDPVVLREATDRCLAGPCHELVISSGHGLRAWIAAARRAGTDRELVARLAGARLLARDPAAADALRALGLREIYSTDREATEDLLRYLLAQPLEGRRVVVQTDRLAVSAACPALVDAGAEVVEVPTYAGAPPAEVYSLRRLGDQLVRGQLDALALVVPSAAEWLCGQAGKDGRLPALVDALRGQVVCTALAAPAAGPLADHRVPVRVAARPFVEELAEELLDALPARGRRVEVAGHEIEVRGQAVVLDGQLIPVPGGPMTVLRALAREPGRVVSAAEIRGQEPTWAEVDDHAVEMAVSRLRRLLPGTDLVQTVVNHGYRLAT